MTLKNGEKIMSKIVLISGGGARRISSTFDESATTHKSYEENLRIDVDATNAQDQIAKAAANLNQEDIPF